MKATELLEQQHREVEKLFKAFEREENEARQAEIFEELASTLVAHDAIERELFYPACEQSMGMSDLLGESLVEHGVIEFSLYETDQAQGRSDFEFKCTVLKEMVEHHVDEEEKDLFPKVEKAFGDDQLELLGKRMEERFEQAREEEFRLTLHENLRQVLAGTLKPRKAKRRAKRASGKHRKSA
jgi:hemerythrin superfamily protein